MGTLVIATSNLGKLDEFKEMFKELPVELKCLADYPQRQDLCGKCQNQGCLLCEEFKRILPGG